MKNLAVMVLAFSPVISVAGGTTEKAVSVGIGIGAAKASQEQTQSQRVKQHNRQTLKSSNNLSTKFRNSISNKITHEAQKRNPVASAYAPSNSVSPITCRAGYSAGAQGTGFGFSFGGSSEDPNCEARADALLLAKFGMKRSAFMRLCQVPEIARSFQDSGEFDCGKYTVLRTVSNGYSEDSNSN